MRKNVLTIFSIFFSAMLFISCNSSEDEVQLPKEVDGNLTILEKNMSEGTTSLSTLTFDFTTSESEVVQFNATVENNELRSTLKFKNATSNWQTVSNFKVNLNDNEYKQKMNDIIVSEATTLKNNFDYETIKKVENIIDIIPEKLFDVLQRDEYYNETSLSVFYHLAAFKSSKRSVDKNTGSCNCGVYKDSQNDKTPFFCSEDILVSADEAYDFFLKVTNEKSFAGKHFNPEKTLLYLKGKEGKLLSASKIDKVFRDEFNNFWNKKLTTNERNEILVEQGVDTSDSKYPYDPSCYLYGVDSGHDCGCCGNYSGGCWLCSWVCYLHDRACTNCGWGCGWACVPGPC